MLSIFSTAIKSLLLNKVRSFLTMLGVIIGVGSVVLLTSIGTGLQSFVTEQFASLGSNSLYVVPGNPFGENGGFGNPENAQIESTKPTLKLSYLDQIMRNNREILNYGAATALGTAEAKYRNTTKKITIYAVTPDYQYVQKTTPAKGQWYTKADEQASERVVFLGSKVATELFGEVDPVNRKIKLDGQTYTVLGVAEERGGGFGGPSFDNYVYMPVNTLFDNFNTELIDSLIFQVKDKEAIPAAQKGIKNTLNNYLEEKQYTVFDQTQLLNTINSVLGALTAGLGGIAAISLIVGGIGIMNIMLVSVTERTREIGLRKAVGATPNLILSQFLIEAALLSIIGGLIGLGIAFLGSLALQAFFPAKVTIEAVLLAFGVSTLVGLIFGAAPARRAAQLSPIEALRYE